LWGVQAFAFAADSTLEGEPESFSNRSAKRKILPENNVLATGSVC
jgi:hypothetical protein